jgi:ZIP family zinc transporter
VSLPLGIAILATAVALGGLAALLRERGKRAMPAIRSFAVVAAAAVALLHLLPEAVDSVGWPALLAAAVGLFGPLVLERKLLHQHGHAHVHRHARTSDVPGWAELAGPTSGEGAANPAPTTALAMGYAAVIAHQAGEGAAVASLAQTGALSPSIVLAIAAHTVPLAMVVAIRVLEVKVGAGRKRAMSLALAGVALSTIVGSLAGNLLGAAGVASFQGWILAVVAGLLLHALSHDALGPADRSVSGRIVDASAGLAGLALALLGIEDQGWVASVPWWLRALGVAFVAMAILGRSFLRLPKSA